MTLLRPEARETLWQWRDLLVGLALAALGLYWVLGSGGVLRWIGVVVIALSALLIFTGVQRGRFLGNKGASGAGIIELNERQLSYMGPDTGVIVPLGAVVRIEIALNGNDALVWKFFTADGDVSEIPSSALGHEKLFDCLSGFPGASYEKVISASSSTQQGQFVIWRKTDLTMLPTQH
ncbi:MAG: hypothetical protein JXR13_14985 [Thalassovita sp.]